jgi:hypothetical protein
VDSVAKMVRLSGKDFTEKVATHCNSVGARKDDTGVPMTLAEEVDGDFFG